MSIASSDKTGIGLGISRVLAIVFVLLHGGAVVLTLLLPLAVSWRASLLVFILFSLHRALMCHALRLASSAVVAFAMEKDGDACRWRKRAMDGWESGRLIDRWVHPRLTLLVARRDDGWWPVSIVIAADAVAPEAFRRLRVRLTLRNEAA